MAQPKYDELTKDMLVRSRVPAYEGDTKLRSNQGLPSNTAGIPGLMVREMPYLDDTNTRGFVLGSNVIKKEMQNRGMQPNMFVASDADNQTVAHEAEHLLARQNAGFSTETRDKFLDMLGKGRSAYDAQDSFLNGLAKAAPYLKEKYGIDNAYMDPQFIKEQGKTGLYEIFATLGGAESALNVDLTKDPVLRETMFSNRKVREAYNAVTGLRQTRLDPRDLPPYTPQEEPPEPGLMGKLKRLMGYAEGGRIDHAGGSKLI